MDPRAILLLAALTAGSVSAREPAPTEHPWCPREEICTDDRLEIVFEGGGSVLEIDDFVPGTRVTATVVMDVKSDDVQGWSYGVRHDQEVLRLVSGRPLIEPTFFCDACGSLYLGPVFECIDTARGCNNRTEGGGFINALVLSLTEPISLDVGRNALVVVEYEIIADPGPAGTFIDLTDRLARERSPPTAINITVGGRSRSPRTVIDGWVRRRGDAGTFFHRGDPDGDGRATVGDAVFLLLHLAAGGPAPACLEAADLDDGGRVDVADAVALLHWLFLGGPGPPRPGPPSWPCGPDPRASPARLGCEAYPSC